MLATEQKEKIANNERSMRDFYQSFGLSNYPFNIFTAENETEYASSLFVHPLNYDVIKGSFDGNRSVIIRGNRGTGKTALLFNPILTWIKDSRLAQGPRPPYNGAIQTEKEGIGSHGSRDLPGGTADPAVRPDHGGGAGPHHGLLSGLF